MTPSAEAAAPEASSNLSPKGQTWLDRTAIFLAVLCGIHCLATPILLVALPLIASTFWVSEHFHLGMLLLVIPTSLLAAYAGCRRHRDHLVIGSIVAGIAVLTFVTVDELVGHHDHHGAEASHSHHAHVAHEHDDHDHSDHELIAHAGHGHVDEAKTAHVGCASCCPVEPTDDTAVASAGLGSIFTGHALLNSLGGLFLVIGHTRNFWLCRRHQCDHRHDR